MRTMRMGERVRGAFTLIELLVVIAVIGVLAALAVPGLGRAKQQAKVTVCLNNLRQIGAGFAQYSDDNDGRMPPPTVTNGPEYGAPVSETYFSIGGRDGTLKGVHKIHVASAAARPLNQYLKNPEVFHCPEDKGIVQFYCPNMETSYQITPSLWEVAGCSYQYNTGLISKDITRRPFKEEFIGGRSADWIPNPAKFIVMHEPPAREWDGTLMHWHYARARDSKATWQPERFPGVTPLAEDPLKFLSPVLFADGHVKLHDFSAEIRADPAHSFEETADWIWYKPSPEPVISLR